MINMEKFLILLVFLLVNTLCPSCAFPNANPHPNPDVIIQINQMVNSGSSGSQTLEEVDEHSEGITTSDEHNSEGDCSHWSYPSTNWPSICPQYCDGERQSPIDINSYVVYPTVEWLRTDYDKIIMPSVNIKNNGHAATISLDSPIAQNINNGGLDGNYTLAQFHFHWGCDNSNGSEHTVDGKSYAMEMHLVHYKESYGSLGEAIKHSDGLAVIGILFEVGSESAALKPITDNLSQITAPGTDADITFNQKLKDFIPGGRPTMWRYEGSLTTPTCNEVVIWTVYTRIMNLSQAQLDAFRSLEDHDGNPLCDNYRAVQPLNGRIISEHS